MERLWCLLIGYFCGTFLTAELVARRGGGGARETLSGNPGMANVASRYGAVSGLLVLLGDMLKTSAACAVCRLWLFPGMGRMAVLWAGFGAVLGHCFPVWRRFRGGKGVAVTGAASFLFSPPVGLLSYLLGGIAVLLTGYLAAGSAVIAAAFPLLTALWGFGAEAVAVAAATGCVMLLRHRENFARMRAGTEGRAKVSVRFRNLLKRR